MKELKKDILFIHFLKKNKNLLNYNKIRYINFSIFKFTIFFFFFFVIIFLNDKAKLKEDKFDSMEDSFQKAKEFINNSINGISYNNKTFILTEKPKVSVIIPIYNCKDFILRAIKSIQNQNLLEIEIILVNDFSTDNTLNVLKNIQKEDQRIKIMNNRKNMGILYSRSIGALTAKGKYIFPLDNDDMFLDKDVFTVIINIAENGNFDIVQFKGICLISEESVILKRKIKNTLFSGHKLNLVLFQPKLGLFPLLPPDEFGKKYKLNAVYLWGKCIKTAIYQKSINKMGKDRYSRNVLNFEDVVAIYTIFNIAQSYKFVGKYGILKISRKNNANSLKHTTIEINIVNIYFADIAIDFTQKNKDNYIFLVYLLLFILNRPQLNETLNSHFSVRKLFFSCFNRIINSKFISTSHKFEIRKTIKNLKYINNNI